MTPDAAALLRLMTSSPCSALCRHSSPCSALCRHPIEAEARREPGVERAAVVAAILFGAVDDETFDSVMAALSDSEAPAMSRQGEPSALGRRHRVYIAGPMKGLPGFNFPAFFEAEARWRALGWDVVNPAAMDQEIDDRDPAQAEAFYMRRDLPAVAGCDAIALLPGWETSSGALKEARVALWCGLAVLDAVTGERIAAGIAAPVDERHPGEHQGAER